VLAAVLDRVAPLTAAGEGAGRGEEDRPPPPVLLGYRVRQGEMKRL
jgi:hypothetical protein